MKCPGGILPFRPNSCKKCPGKHAGALPQCSIRQGFLAEYDRCFMRLLPDLLFQKPDHCLHLNLRVKDLAPEIVQQLVCFLFIKHRKSAHGCRFLLQTCPDQYLIMMRHPPDRILRKKFTGVLKITTEAVLPFLHLQRQVIHRPVAVAKADLYMVTVNIIHLTVKALHHKQIVKQQMPVRGTRKAARRFKRAGDLLQWHGLVFHAKKSCLRDLPIEIRKTAVILRRQKQRHGIDKHPLEIFRPGFFPAIHDRPEDHTVRPRVLMQ